VADAKLKIGIQAADKSQAKKAGEDFAKEFAAGATGQRAQLKAAVEEIAGLRSRSASLRKHKTPAADVERFVIGATRKEVTRTAEGLARDIHRIESGTQKVKLTSKDAEYKKERAMGVAHSRAIDEDKKRDLMKKRGLERDESRKSRAERIGQQRETMRDMVMFHSALQAVTGPLPGGGIIQAGAYGLTSGINRGSHDEFGNKKKGLKGIAGGVLGGLSGMAGGLGIAALAAGMQHAVSGSRNSESWLRTMSRATGGNVGAGGAFVGQARSHGLTAEESIPVSAQALHATRGLGGIDAAMRAQVVSGAGGEMSQLSGALTKGGAFGGGPGADVRTNAGLKKAWKDLFAAGVSQGFRSGNVPEMLAGAVAMANTRVLGGILKEGAGSEMAGLSAGMFKASGGDKAFQGESGFQMMGVANNMVQGKGSSYAQGMSLMNAGLGKGNDLIGAMADSESGLFSERMSEKGKKKTSASERLSPLLAKYSQQAGGDKRAMAMLLMNAGVAPNATAAIKMSEMDPRKLNDSMIKKTMDAAAPIEQQAYKAMAGMDWKTIDHLLESIDQQLGSFFNGIGGPAFVKDVLTKTLEVLTGLAEFFNVKTSSQQNREAVAAAKQDLPEGVGPVASGQTLTRRSGKLAAKEIANQGSGSQDELGAELAKLKFHAQMTKFTEGMGKSKHEASLGDVYGQMHSVGGQSKRLKLAGQTFLFTTNVEQVSGEAGASSNQAKRSKSSVPGRP